MSERSRRPRQGTLVIIGGGEDKEGDCDILNEVARMVDGGKLVVATIASHEPEGYYSAYERVFTSFGVSEIAELYVQDRSETLDPEKLKILDNASGIFFTGGDQLRISSQIGDTPVEERVRDIFARGGVIAGTSAGASVMSDTMLVKGSSRESHRIGDLHMAPGMGLIRDVIIDQHFAERGRIGRLIGAVAHNPRVIGIGIDEDTALLVEGENARVIGRGAIYIVDGSSVTHSNITEAEPDRALTMFDVRLHVLSAGDAFNLVKRRPVERLDKE